MNCGTLTLIIRKIITKLINRDEIIAPKYFFESNVNKIILTMALFFYRTKNAKSPVKNVSKSKFKDLGPYLLNYLNLNLSIFKFNILKYN